MELDQDIQAHATRLDAVLVCNHLTLALWVQVVKTMEREGQIVDKQRIKWRLEQMFSRQSGVKRHRNPQASSVPNENLERLKFWLGLENMYYGQN